MPAIENLADDNHWRVRLAIIKYIPLLATQLGADVFQQQLGQQCMRWLEDQVSLTSIYWMGLPLVVSVQTIKTSVFMQVFCIREAATQNLQKLAAEFGPEWAKEHLVPQVSKFDMKPTRVMRLTDQLPKTMSDLQVLAMVNNSHYLYRMTILTAVAALAPAVSHEVLCNSMLPVVISCAKDKVMSQVVLLFQSPPWLCTLLHLRLHVCRFPTSSSR